MQVDAYKLECHRLQQALISALNETEGHVQAHMQQSALAQGLQAQVKVWHMRYSHGCTDATVSTDVWFVLHHMNLHIAHVKFVIIFVLLLLLTSFASVCSLFDAVHALDWCHHHSFPLCFEYCASY